MKAHSLCPYHITLIACRLLGMDAAMASKRIVVSCVTCNTTFKTHAALQEHQSSRKHHLAVHNAYMDEMKEKCGLFVTGKKIAHCTVIMGHPFWIKHCYHSKSFLCFPACKSQSKRSTSITHLMLILIGYWFIRSDPGFLKRPSLKISLFFYYAGHKLICQLCDFSLGSEFNMFQSHPVMGRLNSFNI